MTRSKKAEKREYLDTVVLNTVVANPGLGMKELFDKLPPGVCNTTDALRHRINRLYKKGIITRHGERNSYTWAAATVSLLNGPPNPEPISPTSAEAIIASIPDGPGDTPPEDPALQELDAMRKIHVLMKGLPNTMARSRVFNWVNQNFDLGQPLYDGRE